MLGLTAAPADLDLAERDRAIPAMAAIFDPASLVADLAPAWGTTGAELRYLRYKPGASLIATVEVRRTVGAPRLVQAVAFGAGAADKLRKIERAGAQDDVGLGALVDPERGVAVVDATADRALPGVHRFLRSADPESVTTLVYKPGRRWVARHEPVDGAASIVKIHRPADVAQLLERHRTTLARGLPVPAITSHHARRGIIAAELVPGAALDSLGPAASRAELWRRTGAVLAQLHGSPVPAGAPRARPGQDLAAAVAAVRAIAPELGDTAQRTAELIRRGTTGRFGRRLVHGDFSADQVIARPDLAGLPDPVAGAATGQQPAVTLVDLDRVRLDDPLVDLASWFAYEALTGDAARLNAPRLDADPAAVLGPLLTGYRDTGAAVDEQALRPFAAAALLQRAAEPFRCRADHWPERVAAIVTAAHRLADR